MKVRRETSGRKGKTATTISEIPLSEAETRDLAKRLKQHCGVGGTARGSTIELQGDQRDKVMAFLGQEGHKAVRAGG
jgi:translation initiation factor 1